MKVNSKVAIGPYQIPNTKGELVCVCVREKERERQKRRVRERVRQSREREGGRERGREGGREGGEKKGDREREGQRERKEEGGKVGDCVHTHHNQYYEFHTNQHITYSTFYVTMPSIGSTPPPLIPHIHTNTHYNRMPPVLHQSIGQPVSQDRLGH